MPVRKMNGRQFKKLCAKCYAIVIAIEPSMLADTVRETETGEGGWHRLTTKGTLGFGRVSGYFDPEWDDWSAWKELRERVFWSFATIPGNEDAETGARDWPTFPATIKPHGWRDHLSLANQIPRRS